MEKVYKLMLGEEKVGGKFCVYCNYRYLEICI